MKSTSPIHLFALSLLAFSAGTAAQRPAAAVETARSELRALTPTVMATGQVRSRSSADLAAGIAGQLDWVAEPGTRLAQGALVARMDVDELRLVRHEQAARLTRSEVALRQADRELERLRASGAAVARFQLDQAENARDLAQADFRIAEAALRQTDERLSRTELRAPFAGVIAERLKRAGEEVNRGELIARLQDPTQLEVRLFLPLRHVGAIHAGSAVQVRSAEASWTAPVRAVVPMGDTRSQSFEALIDLPPQSTLVAGQTVKVELPLQAPQNTLAVPRDALVIRSDGMAVYRVRDGKTAERVSVRSTLADGEWVGVDGALKADEELVVRGAESLQDGAAVKVIGHRKG